MATFGRQSVASFSTLVVSAGLVGVTVIAVAWGAAADEKKNTGRHQVRSSPRPSTLCGQLASSWPRTDTARCSKLSAKPGEREPSWFTSANLSGPMIGRSAGSKPNRIWLTTMPAKSPHSKRISSG